MMNKNVPREIKAGPIFKVPVKIYQFSECSEGRPLQGAQDTHFLIEAPTAQIALWRVMNNPGERTRYNRAPVEERKEIARRFLLFGMRDAPIERVPDCHRRYKNTEGGYICGKPNMDPTGDSSNGEFGGCVVDGYDLPGLEDCPFAKSLEEALTE